MLLDSDKATKTGILVDTISRKLDYYNNMTSREYTLAKKFEEIQGKNSKYSQQELDAVKGMIFNPSNPSEVYNIRPKLTYVNSSMKSGMKTFQILRTFCTAHENVSRIGRALRYLVTDEVTGKYIGIIHISSDMAQLGPRNKYLGISEQINSRDWKCLDHIANCYTLVPMQPFGYNYMGGKLISLLASSDVVENDWNKAYGDKLVGLSTTSLYGSFSQYSNLKYWRKTGHLDSTVAFKLPDNEFDMLKNWAKEYDYEKYHYYMEKKKPSGMPFVRDNKNRFLQYMFRQLGFKTKDFQCSHQRGTFFCSLFNETPEFLQGNTEYEQLTRRYDNSVESLTAMWKERYAKKRLSKLEESSNLKSEILFYDRMMNSKNWDEAKSHYLMG